MATVFYVLECTARGCDAEFYLNDIPVARRGPSLGAFAGVQSNELVVDGVNELAVVINPGPTPADALCVTEGRRRVVMREAFVKGRLVRYPRGAVVGGPDGDELLSVEWAVPVEAKVVCPRVESTQADLGRVFGRWSFEDAPRLALDDAARDEVTKLVEALHANLDRGSPEALIEHSRVRLDEVSFAYDLDDGEKEDVIRAVTAEDAAREGWGLKPLDRESFSLRRCAHGRLVEVVGRDWRPVLQEKPAPDGSVGLYDMFVARLDDAWHIVR